MRTYVNGLAVIYNQSGRASKITLSSTMQFPKFNAFMRGCVTTHRSLEAIKEASRDAAEFGILQDHELRLLWDNTNFSSIYEVQRMGLAIMAYRLGFRGDTLLMLDIDMYSMIVEDDKNYLQPVVGTMKNLAGTFGNIERALFKQRVAECQDYQFCAVWWYQKLVSLSPKLRNKKGPLFHSLVPLSKKVNLETPRGGYGLCRGVATWVGEVVDRPNLTMKDIGRRPVFTKLANSEITLADAAKYLGVCPKTLGVYHRAHVNTATRAALVLSAYVEPKGKPKVAAEPAGECKVDPDVVDSSGNRDMPASQSSVSSSLREYIVAQAHDSPAKETVVSEDMLPQGTESPGKGTLVSEDFKVEAIDTSPNKGSVASDALSIAESVDLLANDVVVVSSDSEWDYDEHPLTQVSLKRSFAEARESYRAAAWAAAAAPADSPVNQDLSNTPRPFKKMRRPRFPPRTVPREHICYKCSREIFVLRPLRGGNRVQCNACNVPFHEKCFYSSTVKPEDGVGPCCLEAKE